MGERIAPPPSRPQPLGDAPPLSTLPSPPHLRLCLLAPASRSWGSEDPGAPICALQIPRNVKLGGRGEEGSREGRQKLGASPSLWKSKEPPSSQRPCWYPDCPPSPNPEGTSVPCTFASLFIPLSCQVSHLPWAPKAWVSLSRSPPRSLLPFLIPSYVSEPPTTFCVVLHGFAVMEKVETQQSLKLDPRGQVDRSQARPPAGAGREVRGREGRGEPMARVVPLAGENQVAFSHIPRGPEGIQPSNQHSP